MIGSQSSEEIQKKSIGKRSRFDEFSDSEYGDQSDRNRVRLIGPVQDPQAVDDELKQEDQDVVGLNETFFYIITDDEDSEDNVPLTKSKQLANHLLSYPIPPDLYFSDQTASKASVLLVQKYLKQNPNYPLKKKIETNLNQQVIPKLCEGDYQLKPSTKGYTLFDAKVVPWNGKDGFLRFKTKYTRIIKYDTVGESEAAKARCDKVQQSERKAKARIAAIDLRLQSPMSLSESTKLQRERADLVDANHNLKAAVKLRTEIPALLKQIRDKCIASDRKKFSNEEIDNAAALELVTHDWEDSDGSCCFCGRDIVFLGATDSGDQASLDRMKNGLSHFHSDQIRKFVCLMCNWGKRHHTIRQFTIFIQKLRESTAVDHKLIPITTEDVTVIKKMAYGYAKNDKTAEKASAKVTTKSPLCVFEGETATPEEFVAVARRDGRMDPIARIIGNWTHSTNDIFKLGFDRLLSSEGPRCAPTIRRAHSKNNIRVRLQVLNMAQNRFGDDELISWMEGLKKHNGAIFETY